MTVLISFFLIPFLVLFDLFNMIRKLIREPSEYSDLMEIMISDFDGIWV